MWLALPDDSTTPTRQRLLMNKNGVLYLKSWLLMRFVVGLVGVALPFAVILGDVFVFPGEGPFPRDSLSAYYHSGVRDIFVGSLCVIGLFLITYMVFHYNPDNVVTIVAGLAAICVAFLPTSTDGRNVLTEAPTPLEMRFGEQNLSHIHAGAAAIFMILMTVMSWRFAAREGDRGNLKRRMLHRACAVIMAVFLVVKVAFGIVGVDTLGGISVLLVTELACTFAFGISWLVKGGELITGISKPSQASSVAAAT